LREFVAASEDGPGPRTPEGARMSLVTILAFGSTGDTRPMVALGHALRVRGMHVRVLAPDCYGPLVHGAGLEHAPLAVDPMEILRSPEGQALLATRNPVSLARGFQRIVRPRAEEFLDEALEATKGSDAVLGPATGFVGYHVGQYLGIPTALLHLQPGEPTRTAANPLVAAGRDLGGPLNRASYEVLEQLAWLAQRPIVNRWRRERLGLRPIPASGPFRLARRERMPVLAGYSAAVCPAPPDWPDTVVQTGWWFLDGADPADPAPPDVPAALVRFLAAGPPPVCVGFGSMVPADPERTWTVVRAALRRAGVRGVLLGDPGTAGLHEADGVVVVPWVDHGWLFPRTAAVVHHGGAGTTGAALRAGVPSVVCPFFSDQPFWAARVARLNAGPAPLPIKRLTAVALAARIRRALGDASMRADAAALGERIRDEDGVTAAASWVEQWLPSATPPAGPGGGGPAR
jgi:UDP:flavonoid glycosyltransferase YjiC (YdhE family)